LKGRSLAEIRNPGACGRNDADIDRIGAGRRDEVSDPGRGDRSGAQGSRAAFLDGISRFPMMAMVTTVGIGLI